MIGNDAIQPGDHLGPASGQTVHCTRAFMISSTFPLSWHGRFQLGFQLGCGLACGGVMAAGLLALVSKALKVLFA